MKKSGKCSVLELSRRFLKRFALVLVFTLSICAWAETADSDSLLARNRQIAQAYADSAFSLYTQNKFDEALALADAAIDFEPKNSDALVIKYFVLGKSGSKRQDLMTLLETALLADSFKNFFREDISFRLAKEYLFVRDPYRALKLSETILYAPYRLFILASANLELGNLDRARDLFFAYIRTNDGDIESVIPLLMRLRSEPYSEAHALFVNYISYVLLPYVRYEHPELLPALVPYAQDAEAARLLIREYRAYNHFNAYCSLYAFTYGLVSFETMTDEIFLQGSKIPYEVYQSIFEAVPDPESSTQLAKKLSAWSGLVYIDVNYDGIPESSLEFQQGLPVYLVSDKNQDGNIELDCLFHDGIPEKITLNMEAGYISISYYRWPQVRTIVAQFKDSGIREYRYVPGALDLPMLAQELLLANSPSGTGLWYEVPARIPVPASDMLVRSAAEIVKRQGNSTIASQLQEGYLAYATGHNLSSSFLAYYEEGFPVAEKVDIDGDGVFEARRYYTRNAEGVPVLSELRVDDDQNGVVEYVERYVPIATKLWDIDQDGLADIIVTNEGGGTERYEVSLDSSGIMNLVIFAKGGLPYRVLLQGKELPMIQDSNPRVVWIGQKYFDFGSKTPAQGWGVYEGNRYYVLAAGGLFFVQAMSGLQ